MDRLTIAGKTFSSRLIVGNCDDSCTTFGYGSIDELAAFVDEQFRSQA